MQETVNTLSINNVTKLDAASFGMLDKSPGPSRWVRDEESYRVMLSWPSQQPEQLRFARVDGPLLVTNYSFCASVVYSVSSWDVKLKWDLLINNGSVMSRVESSDRGGRLSLTFPVGHGRLVLLAMLKSQAKGGHYVANISTVTFTLGDCRVPGEKSACLSCHS